MRGTLIVSNERSTVLLAEGIKCLHYRMSLFIKHEEECLLCTLTGYPNCKYYLLFVSQFIPRLNTRQRFLTILLKMK